MNFEHDGYRIIEQLISSAEVQAVIQLLDGMHLEPLRGGIRRIDHLIPQIGELARSPRLLEEAKQHLSSEPALVRAIFFDKTPENNWFVTWHQDRTVAVSNRFEMEGWGPWSMKSELWHVQPPLAVLQNMVTIRVHLDQATVSNGCLKVIPGSHQKGILSNQQLQDLVQSEESVDCEVPAGGALLMRPHLLHASGKSLSSLPRRVLHFEYSSYALPHGTSWVA